MVLKLQSMTGCNEDIFGMHRYDMKDETTTFESHELRKFLNLMQHGDLLDIVSLNETPIFKPDILVKTFALLRMSNMRCLQLEKKCKELTEEYNDRFVSQQREVIRLHRIMDEMKRGRIRMIEPPEEWVTIDDY